MAAALLALAAAPAAPCELALALAVDVSGSVEPREYRLQMDGIAAALGESTVAEALVAGRVAVAVIQWSGSSRQAVVVPWLRVEDAAALARLRDAVAGAERRWWMFSTGVGEALAFSAAQFGPVGDCGRRVIDVSGDGRSNEGRAPKGIGAALAEAGFTVNGLAITGSEPFLEQYYRDNVIAGPGAFVLAARGYSDYPEAIRRKLVAEVTKPVTQAPGRMRRAEAGR